MKIIIQILIGFLNKIIRYMDVKKVEVSVEELEKGILYCKDNVADLLKSSEKLLEIGRLKHAHVFYYHALEEFGKLVYLSGKLREKNVIEIETKKYFDHKFKIKEALNEVGKKSTPDKKELVISKNWSNGAVTIKNYDGGGSLTIPGFITGIFTEVKDFNEIKSNFRVELLYVDLIDGQFKPPADSSVTISQNNIQGEVLWSRNTIKELINDLRDGLGKYNL